MIWRNHAAKLYLCASAFLLIALFMLFGIEKVTSQTQNANSNMRSLLQRLVDQETTFVIVFNESLNPAENGWILPSDITDDGNIIGRRVVREIGDDFICIDVIGQGVTDVNCIPFSNIRYISFV